MKKCEIAVVIPNWNGKAMLGLCIEAVQAQTVPCQIIIVDDGSSDNSAEYIDNNYPDVIVLKHKKNQGFATAMNTGIKKAFSIGFRYVASLNNDAVVDRDWMKYLKTALDKDKNLGAATGIILTSDGKSIDNTGDQYSIWGLTIARQRGDPASKAIDSSGLVFGACAGSCLYKSKALKAAGLFDDKFFAYYEDTDLNFRLQINGWKIAYTPHAITYHSTGSTSSKIKGFTTYHTLKNLPMLFWKNVPFGLLHVAVPRFMLAYWLIFFSSIANKRGWPAIKGLFATILLLPHVVVQRNRINFQKKVDTNYIKSILVFDLPPNAHRLRKLRKFFTGKP